MKSKNIEVSKEVADEIWKLNGQILELKQEIHELKNCANCRHIIWGDGELLCSKNWVGNKMDKCDYWQKL